MVLKSPLLSILLVAGAIGGSALVLPTPARSNQDQDVSAVPPAPAKTAVRKASPYRPSSQPASATTYYQSMWGVDNFLVRSTASGNLIRFSYRVTDPVRARQLGEGSATPYMIGLRSRAVLQVPVMDKVGPLRQSSGQKAGQEYWMVFSNKGNPVKVGDRVNVVIGTFHAEGLMVE
jgi:hypothetical protein